MNKQCWKYPLYNLETKDSIIQKMYVHSIHKRAREARGTQVENDLMDSLQTTRYISIIETAAMTRGNHIGKTSLSKKNVDFLSVSRKN